MPLLTCAPGVEEQNKLPQEPGRHLVATGHLQAQLIAADGRFAGAAHGEVDAVAITRCRHRAPGPSDQLVGEGKRTPGVLGLGRAWACRGKEGQHGGGEKAQLNPTKKLQWVPSNEPSPPPLGSLLPVGPPPLPTKGASPSFPAQAVGRGGLSPLGPKGPQTGTGVSRGLLGWSMPRKGWDLMAPEVT